LPIHSHVYQQFPFTFALFINERTLGYLDIKVTAILAMLFFPGAIFTPFRSKPPSSLIVFKQRIHTSICNDENIATMAPIPTIGTTKRDILLPAKADNAIAAISCPNVYLDFIDHCRSPILIETAEISLINPVSPLLGG
jgi:hypothetical protein